MKKQANEIIKLPTGFARKLARNLIKKSKIDNPPVRLNQIFKVHHKDIQVKGQDLGSEDGFSIGSHQIIYNSSKPVVRQRFTVAHELGHILLGHNFGSKIINFESNNPNEQLANIFSSELLVPLFMLKEENLHLSTLSEIATKYWVSREMMRWRLQETNLDLRLGSWK